MPTTSPLLVAVFVLACPLVLLKFIVPPPALALIAWMLIALVTVPSDKIVNHAAPGAPVSPPLKLVVLLPRINRKPELSSLSISPKVLVVYFNDIGIELVPTVPSTNQLKPPVETRLVVTPSSA